MTNGFNYQANTEFGPLTGVTNFEEDTRKLIYVSTQSELHELQKSYKDALKKQNSIQDQIVSSPLLKDIFARLLMDIDQQIKEKYESLKKSVYGVTPKLRGDVPDSFQGEGIKVLKNGKIFIGFKNTGSKEKNPGAPRTLSGGIYITYEDYLKKSKGKFLDIGDYRITLFWGKGGEPILDWKKIQQERAEEKNNVPQDFSPSRESPQIPIEVQKTQQVLADLRRKILTDTSSVSQKIFAGKERRNLDLSRMTYAAGSTLENISYAQVMEDGGKIYSVWGEVDDQIRPLILVDRERLKIIFSGTIGRDNLIFPNPGFQWPKNRDVNAYKFQPKLNIQWKL